MGARNRGGIGLSYWPLESIPGLHKRLKIRASRMEVKRRGKMKVDGRTRGGGGRGTTLFSNKADW